MEKTNQPPVVTAVPRRCPVFPKVPIMLAVVIVVALAVVIVFSLTAVLAGHPADLASGIIWA